jgi:hypothetical protein
MDWVGDTSGHTYKTESFESGCASESHDHCVFTVTPKS